MMLLHDNAPVHKSKKLQAAIVECDVLVITNHI